MESPQVTSFVRLPSFIGARRAFPKLLVFGIALALAGTFLPESVELAAAAAWLAAAGFFSVAMLSYVRAQVLKTEQDRLDAAEAESQLLFSDNSSSADAQQPPAFVRHALARLSRWIPRLPSMGEGMQALVVVICGSIAILEIVQWWRTQIIPSGTSALKITGGALLFAAFPLLVLQQTYAGASLDRLPEARQLDRLLRLPLIACAVVGISLIAIAGGFEWAMQIQRVMAVVLFAAALELILRGFTTIFVPWPTIEKKRAIGDSAVAGFLLRLKLPSWRTVNTAVRNQLGINLSRSWALAFLQRGTVPLVVGIVLASWLFTGVTVLGINQRGVYERFGQPVAVLSPGLHVHLPWPFGALRIVETGVVHQLPIEFVLPDSNGQLPEEEKEEHVSAEAPAPTDADRLWDDAHPFEGSYLIASEENNRQSFQLVNVDMAIVYQVGTSDEAARNAAYRVGDAEAFIQALSGQILVRYLSHHQVLELLGESRENLSADFRLLLQQQLDHFNAGVDVLAISIEAIHPPPGAASAYHDVQAAQIRSTTHVAESRGNAARSDEQAQQSAATQKNEAVAAAAERTSQAQIAATLFGGDQKAYANGGDAFLMERWFDDLKRTLREPDVLLIDHRLKGQASPTLDMRSLSPAPFDRTMMRE